MTLQRERQITSSPHEKGSEAIAAIRQATDFVVEAPQNLVKPYIREAIRVLITPQPDDNAAVRIASKMKDKWADWKDGYRSLIAKISGCPTNELQFAEEVRDEWEGYTRQVDFQRLRYYENDHPILDTRVCGAICVPSKSKLWNRVQVSSPENSYGVPLDELKSEIQRSKSINAAATRWFYERTREVFHESFPNKSIEECGSIEVSTYGIKDLGLKDFFDLLPSDKRPLSMLIKDLKIKQKLSSYLDVILSTADSIDRYILSDNAKDVRWFTSPTYVNTASGDKELREVLYLATSSKNVDRFIGLRYDDSIDGKLPRESSLELSRWLGISL
jgi:hypothetical protein